MRKILWIIIPGVIVLGTTYAAYHLQALPELIGASIGSLLALTKPIEKFCTGIKHSLMRASLK